jgi:hypothetical protein
MNPPQPAEATDMQAPGRPRRLDRKLASIAAGAYTPDDFVLADAKDADMGFGLTAPGPIDGGSERPLGPGRYRTRQTYIEAMGALVRQGLLDVLLTSAANGERVVSEGWLDEEVTLAVRANDTTDIWLARGATYSAQPSRPFRTADLEAVRSFCDLVLYSVTLNNDLERDLATLEAYREFRLEAASLGIRHFLEIFNPNAPSGLRPSQVPAFINDSIVRLLAGMTATERPLFLKMTYNGAAALAELVEHDPSLVVGILGGTAGTTRDTFELLRRIEIHGGRVALFGRKIQQAESQLELVALMPAVLRGELRPEDAVRAYHEALAKAGIEAQRTIEADARLTDAVLLSE